MVFLLHYISVDTDYVIKYWDYFDSVSPSEISGLKSKGAIFWEFSGSFYTRYIYTT
jgi:hypothetical protein